MKNFDFYFSKDPKERQETILPVDCSDDVLLNYYFKNRTADDEEDYPYNEYYWEDLQNYPFGIQRAKQIGYMGFDYSLLPQLEGTGFDADKLNGNPREVNPFEFYKRDLWVYDTYDNSVILDIVNNFLPNFDKPILLVYCQNDPWTGARATNLNPVARMAFGDGEDLGKKLNANMVHVEHRNFGRSFNQNKGKWEYETSAQVSADLHAIYQALKPIFKGKWMSTGTSKNGETSMDYAYYYPNDMDLAVAFCSPFCVSLDDKCFGDYLFNEANTEEIRDLMKKHIRAALENGEEGLYQVCCELFKQRGKPLPSFTEYVYNIFDAFFMVFQNSIPSQHKAEIKDMTQDAKAYAKRIYQTILSNREESFYTYHVDCVKEQGFTNAGYDYFADLLEGTSFKAEDVWQFLLKEEDQWLVKQYDNSIRLDMRENFFMNSTILLLFYYSQPNPWSAAQPDKLGPNAKKVINPIGIHSSKINDPTSCPEDIKQEVMDFISTYIY